MGEPAKRLHTGRSRNEQVSVDFRLYLMRRIPVIQKALAARRIRDTSHVPSDGGPTLPAVSLVGDTPAPLLYVSATQINAPTSPTACVPTVRVAAKSALPEAVSENRRLWAVGRVLFPGEVASQRRLDAEQFRGLGEQGLDASVAGASVAGTSVAGTSTIRRISASAAGSAVR